MSDHVCVLCRVYRPDSEPRRADTVCPGDQARLERDLLAIRSLFHRVVEDEPAETSRRWYEIVDAQGHGTGKLRRCWDPIAQLLPASAVPARRNKPSVTGSREAPLPIDVDAIDLTAAARNAEPTGDPRDQIGYLPVATVLDGWARHFRDTLRPGFHLPGDDVDDLITFLHRHLVDAVHNLPGPLPAFAADLRSLGSALRAILRDTEPQPQPLIGVRCQHCKTMSTLVPWPTGEYVECRACGQLYTDTDRVALVKDQVAQLSKPRAVTVDGTLPGYHP